MSERRWIRNSGPVAPLLKYFARIHVWVYRRTNGRLGAKLLWFPTALLTTTGRKSSEPARLSSDDLGHDGRDGADESAGLGHDEDQPLAVRQRVGRLLAAGAAGAAYPSNPCRDSRLRVGNARANIGVGNGRESNGRRTPPG
jgi:hypothetical protein